MSPPPALSTTRCRVVWSVGVAAHTGPTPLANTTNIPTPALAEAAAICASTRERCQHERSKLAPLFSTSFKSMPGSYLQPQLRLLLHTLLIGQGKLHSSYGRRCEGREDSMCRNRSFSVEASIITLRKLLEARRDVLCSFCIPHWNADSHAKQAGHVRRVPEWACTV